MSSLAAQHDTFWASVRTSPGPSNQAQVFVGDEVLSAPARLGIYRTAYWVRQVEVLRELFPTVVARLGDGPFAREASRFIQKHPSRGRAIEDLGAGFPAALESLDASVATAAALDWARWQALVAPDEALLHASSPELANLTATHLCLASHVFGVTRRVVWRAGFEVMEADLEPLENTMLEQTRAGLRFEAWCEGLRGDEAAELAAPRVLETFRRWLSRGFFRSSS